MPRRVHSLSTENQRRERVVFRFWEYQEVSFMTGQSTASKSLWRYKHCHPINPPLTQISGSVCDSWRVCAASGSSQVQPGSPEITPAAKLPFVEFLLPLFQVFHRHCFKCLEQAFRTGVISPIFKMRKLRKREVSRDLMCEIGKPGLHSDISLVSSPEPGHSCMVPECPGL